MKEGMETPSERKARNSQLGAGLIKAFHHIVSTLRIHKDNNQLIRESVTKFNAILAEISGGNDFIIKIWRGRFYLQGEKLLYQRETFHIINELEDYFSQRGIVGLSFHAEYADAMPEDFLAFTRILAESVKYDDPRAWLDEQLVSRRFSWVDLSLDHEENTQKADARRKEKARYAYFQALNTVKEVAIKSSKGLAGVRKARRLAQTLVDLIQEDKSLLLGMATIRRYDDYTYNHSVNVALLATCLGRYIGLSEIYLEHLTVCGLFHDLGKVEVPKEILLKQGRLNEEEWHDMRKHPLVGVRQILHLHAPHALRSRIILGPFEHHLNIDLSGYPRTHFMKKLSLMGKILRIADVYEALTADRVYRPRAFTPDEALRRMWSEAGKSFDPLLLKSFINMMGIYPVGSFVELDTGEIGLVMEYTDASDRSLPLVALLVDDGKGGLTRGETVNLATQDEDGNSPLRKIVTGIPPARLGIQPAHFLLQGTAAS
ncbi:MAG TPA: HD domain-containing protein [Deltaproteobacteria bacterium]|nr:HD domain-containing protein [Deltaproteobacteria bacterium]HPR54202.1 HD domain-containing protein [Deltaproteobacteria bacterium]HXK45887.1 HD domain-containing protein [Deltaproteobacteria bacterium]